MSDKDLGQGDLFEWWREGKKQSEQRDSCSLTMIFFEGGGRRFLTWLLCSFRDWSSSGGGLRGGHLDLDSDDGDDEDDDGDVALGYGVVTWTLIVMMVMMRMMMVMLHWIAEWSPRP